jgi:hypothetical protein
MPEIGPLAGNENEGTRSSLPRALTEVNKLLKQKREIRIRNSKKKKSIISRKIRNVGNKEPLNSKSDMGGGTTHVPIA